MKSTIFAIFLSLLIFFSSLNAQETGGIQFFKGNYQEALVKAEKENKLIFMDCYTSWCVPCKKLATEIFPLTRMGNLYNANFINIQMDMEKGVGIELTKKFGVTAYPTLLLINSEGYKVDQIVGYWEADTLMSWALRGMNKRKTLTPEMKFDNGERDAAFISSYFKKLIDEGQINAARAALQQILSKEGFKALLLPKYFQLINLLDFDDPALVYLAQHQDQFAREFSRDSLNQKIRAILISVRPLGKIFPYEMPRGYKEDAHKKLQNKIRELNFPDTEFMLAELEVYVLSKTGRVAEAFQIAESTLRNAKDPWRYYEMALMVNWCFYNPDYKSKAASWLEKASNSSKDKLFKVKARAVIQVLRQSNSDSLLIPTVNVMGKNLYGR